MKHARAMPAQRQLSDLVSIGPAMIGDFQRLGITRVAQLCRYTTERGSRTLYNRLCSLTGARHDPCVIDAFAAAIAQARDPRLSKEKCNWWYWSAVRKASAARTRARTTR